MKKVEIISYQEDKPKKVATFFWSPKTGVTCDHENLRDSLSFGVAVPPEGDLIYADQGAEFLGALKFRFTAILRARDPVDALTPVKGKPIESRRGQSSFARKIPGPALSK
jgi:hypothetical protein